MQPKESGGTGTGETREMIVTRQAKDMLNKLPPAYDPFEVKARLQIMGITQPMNIFLKQEIDRMQVVIRLVRSMLKDLLLAIDGVIIMNEVYLFLFIYTACICVSENFKKFFNIIFADFNFYFKSFKINLNTIKHLAFIV